MIRWKYIQREVSCFPTIPWHQLLLLSWVFWEVSLRVLGVRELERDSMDTQLEGWNQNAQTGYQSPMGKASEERCRSLKLRDAQVTPPHPWQCLCKLHCIGNLKIMKQSLVQNSNRRNKDWDRQKHKCGRELRSQYLLRWSHPSTPTGSVQCYVAQYASDPNSKHCHCLFEL